MLRDRQGRASHNWHNQGFHRFPHLCHPWVWSSHRLPFRQTFRRKTFPWEPWWEVWENCSRHSYLALRKSNGRAPSQQMTHSRRINSYPYLFHMNSHVKQNIHHHPHSNPSHVPLAIQTLFSMMVMIQRWSYMIYPFRKKTSVQWTCCLVPHAPTRNTTTYHSSFTNFLEGWLSMHMFIINIADLVHALWY